MPGTPIKIDRIAPARRPRETAVGYQTWSDLLFVHWRVPSYELEPLHEARLLEVRESLLKSARITPRSAPEHVMYSERVDVEIFHMRPIG